MNCLYILSILKHLEEVLCLEIRITLRWLHVGVDWSQWPDVWQILEPDPLRPYPLLQLKVAVVPTGYPPFTYCLL